MVDFNDILPSIDKNRFFINIHKYANQLICIFEIEFQNGNDLALI